MPISKAPYKRTYKHTKRRGREYLVHCDLCGRLVPKYKTFVIRRRFVINDPVILKNVDKRFLSLGSNVMRVCPKCARFLGVAQPGKSPRRRLR